MSYEPATTAILLVDPYNDFLSEGGKLWPRVEAIATQVHLLDHLRHVLAAARAGGFPVVFVPHHRWQPGDYVSFDHPTPYQLGSATAQVFAKDTWGGTFHDDFQPHDGDIVALEHWGLSGFANTDLDLQLKQHGIRRIVLIGMRVAVAQLRRRFYLAWTEVQGRTSAPRLGRSCTSQLYNGESPARRSRTGLLTCVGDTGIEPVTSSV